MTVRTSWAERCRVQVDAGALTARLQQALRGELAEATGQCLLVLRLRQHPGQLKVTLARDDDLIVERTIPIKRDGMAPALRAVVLLVTTYLEKPENRAGGPKATQAGANRSRIESVHLSAAMTLLWWNEPADTQPGVQVAGHLSLSRRWWIGLRGSVTGFVPPEPAGIDLDVTEVSVTAELQFQLWQRHRFRASILAGGGINIGQLEVKPTVYAGPPKPQSFNEVQGLFVIGASVGVRLWPNRLRLVVSGGVQVRLNAQQIKLRPYYPSAGIIEPGHLVPWVAAGVEVGV